VLVDQFNRAKGHNGQLTLGENIGDNVGLTASLKAASTNPKFDNETRKKFFLQYAHVWCSLYRPSFEEQQLKTNPHALGWARTNEQIKQQSAFKTTFQCKDGDQMVLPDDKIVHVW
jgi:putative endopeptidase